MANLIAIAYPDESTAREVLNTLARLQTEKSIELEDAVIVTRNQDGKVKLHQTSKTAAMGATGGALWGGLIGLIFLAPLLGMAVGAAGGGAPRRLAGRRRRRRRAHGRRRRRQVHEGPRQQARARQGRADRACPSLDP